jgi:PAS domain S-box-containing protein
MPAAALPRDEDARVAALRSLGILDTPAEERFDRVTRVASALFDVPIALVSLVDVNRQWFKSCVGLDIPETPRAVSFCAHAILGEETLVIPDTLEDARVADNPFVTSEPHVRFYAGRPLLAGGHALGTLCLIDTRPRTLDERELGLLDDLAAWAEQELADVQRAQAARLLRVAEARWRAVVEHVADAILTFGTDGRVQTANEAAGDLFGTPVERLIGVRVDELFPGRPWSRLATGLADGTLLDRPLRAVTAARDGREGTPVALYLADTEIDGRPVFIAVAHARTRGT